MNVVQGYAVVNGRRAARITITTRDRMQLNLALAYLVRRGIDVACAISEEEQIRTELALTPEERAEVIVMADDMQWYFRKLA